MTGRRFRRPAATTPCPGDDDDCDDCDDYGPVMTTDPASPRRPDPDDPPTNRRPPPTAVTLLGLGIANACALVAGLALGWFVDHELGTAPVFLLVGLASGIVLGVVGTFVEIRRFL